MPDATFKQNDTRPATLITLKRNGVVIDLTNATSVKLIAKLQAGATTFNSMTVIQTPKTNGQVLYTPIAADTATVGVYNAECEITWNDGGIETVPNLDFFVIEIVDDLG